jgi:hypothetical protein
MHDRLSRRRFLLLLPTATATALSALRPGGLHALLADGEHPEPRPGIDGSKVLPAAALVGAPDLIRIYDGVREIPHIADGIRCYCGCANLQGYRSLLTCFEEGGMARHCEICQSQGSLAHSRWKEGQSLAQIRRATDARFGGRSARQPSAPTDCAHHA